MSAIDAERAAKLRARFGSGGAPPKDGSGNISAPAYHEQPAPKPQPAPPVATNPLVVRQEPALQTVQHDQTREGRGEIRTARRTRRDIRSISATGRLVQFSSRITPEVDARIGEIIERRQSEINASRRGGKYKYGICNFLEEAVFLFEVTPTAEE